jgi:hypothetical protein
VSVATVADRPLRYPIAGAAVLAALAFWLFRQGSMYLIVTALTVNVLVIAATSLATYPAAKGSYVISAERPTMWLIFLASITFALFRSPIALFLLVFRDEPPSLADRLSSLTFVVSAVVLFVALLGLPFRWRSRPSLCRTIWVVLVVLDVTAVVQTVLNG